MKFDGCTGFPDRLFQWDWSTCCDVHDFGGTDGQLLDCLFSTVPEWAWPIMALCVALMVLFRPIYRILSRRP